MDYTDGKAILQAWLLGRAREKPNNPLYAHLQAKAALEVGEGVEGQKKAGFVRSIPPPVETDNKSRAAGEEREEKDQDSREEVETPGILGEWDASEPIEEEENA